MDDSADETGESVFDGLKNGSLKTAGWAYLLGDASLFAAGLMKGEYKEAATGALWGIAGLFPAFYANPKAEKQLELLSARLGQYLQSQGIEIPKEPTTALLTRPQGVWDHVQSFFYAYPSQMLNAVYAIGSVSLFKSGFQKKNFGDKAAGALVMAGALAGLLVPEKKIDPEHPPTTAFGKMAAWFQEKPLRISSAFYYANNAGLIRGAWEDKRKNPANKGYLLKYLTAASYIFGNGMLAMSSKSHSSHGDSHKEALEKLSISAARVIAAQPKDVQETLLQHVAGYLASQPGSHLKADEIAALLHTKLAETGKAVPAGWQARMLMPSGLQPTPSL